MNSSKGRYYAKKALAATWEDLTIRFDGLAVLEMKGFCDKGAAVNIYNEQWVNSQREDFMITTRDYENNPVIIRANVDIELTFIVRQKYATSGNINVQDVHDSFVRYMTNSDLWLRSTYMGNKYVHCVCLKEYKPTTVKLGRGNDSFMIGTLTLHTLDAPQ